MKTKTRKLLGLALVVGLAGAARAAEPALKGLYLCHQSVAWDYDPTWAVVLELEGDKGGTAKVYRSELIGTGEYRFSLPVSKVAPRAPRSVASFSGKTPAPRESDFYLELTAETKFRWPASKPRSTDPTLKVYSASFGFHGGSVDALCLWFPFGIMRWNGSE